MFQSKHFDTDLCLIQRAQNGDAAGFERLTIKYRDPLKGLALRMLRNVDEAEDAVQEALLKAFNAIQGFQPNKPFLPWLLRITSNCCVDILRQKHRIRLEHIDTYEFMLGTNETSVDTKTETKLLAEAMMEAIRRLPQHYRQIMEMRFLNHMEVNEIADALKKPEGTIKSWFHRARSKIQRDLQVTVSLPTQ